MTSICSAQLSLVSRLLMGTALAGIFAVAGTEVAAQNETVTVTGTSIRGQQPVGANVITVDRTAIEATGAQTTAQLLQTIPQLDNFGSAAQGGQNSADGSAQTPTIHSLGRSASNSTLI
jgi:iron complex outermembrane receptor protein